MAYIINDVWNLKLTSIKSPKTSLGVLDFTKDSEIVCPVNVDFLDQFPPSSLSEEDARILMEIRESLEETSELPYTWTPQEQHFLDRHPKSMWISYLIFRFKFRMYPKRKTVSDFPIYALIEPASACNLRCPMCFQMDSSFTRKPFMGVMPMDLYKKVVDELKEGGTGALTMGSRGEPTLNKKLGEMLQYASGKFLELKLITNATFLTEELSHAILKSDVNILVFSVDAHEKELYEEIRVNADFDQTYENICRFEEIRRTHYPESPLVSRVAGVRVRPDQDPKAFTQFWGKICDEVAMKDAFERWDTYKNKTHPELTDPCYIIWERIYIWFDGATNPCDADYKSNLSPGSVRDQSIHDIWHGEALQKLRDVHLAGNRASLTPCDRCGIS